MKCIGCSREAAPNRSRCAPCLSSIRRARARYYERNRERALASDRASRARKRAAGLCACGAPAVHGKTRCAPCLGEHRYENERRRNSRKQAGLCRACGASADGRSHCRRCLDTIGEKTQALRREVITAYGARCECCGETEPRFLQIDHPNDDGKEHRKTVRTTTHLYRWLKQRAFPRDGFRLLCANCNLGRFLNGGVCPHIESIGG